MLAFTKRMDAMKDTPIKIAPWLGVLLASFAPAVMGADISGVITLKGLPAPEQFLPLDPLCVKLHGDKKPSTRFWVTGKNNGLADVFIHIKSGLKASDIPAPSKQPVVLDQSKCEYLPYVLGVQTGQTLEVRNSDPVLHNIHPTPNVEGNKEQNLAQLPMGPPVKFVFEKPEILLRIKCDIHPWMFAYVGVVEHPFFAVSNKDGAFAIKNVPPGEYVLEVFHRKGGKQERKIVVGKDGVKGVGFTVEVPK